MRTTLDIDDDVLQGAKEWAARERTTTGRVILGSPRLLAINDALDKKRVLNGISLLPSRGEIVTMKRIQDIMDEEGI